MSLVSRGLDVENAYMFPFVLSLVLIASMRTNREGSEKLTFQYRIRRCFRCIIFSDPRSIKVLGLC